MMGSAGEDLVLRDADGEARAVVTVSSLGGADVVDEAVRLLEENFRTDTDAEGGPERDGGLPTIEWLTASRERRELAFERADPDEPWSARLWEVEFDDNGERRTVGSEPLREVRVDGVPRTPVDLFAQR